MSKNSEKVVVTVGPPGNPYAKIIRRERRLGIRDRRRLNTYIAKERRGGLSERRKSIVPRLRRLRTEDRRQSHTYLAKDRRNGIADRRNPKRICQMGGEGKLGGTYIKRSTESMLSFRHLRFLKTSSWSGLKPWVIWEV